MVSRTVYQNQTDKCVIHTNITLAIITPLLDMMNHDNQKYNVNHMYNVYSDPFSHEGYEIVTTKAIPAGEELMNSYNRCNICSDLFDWFGTPEVSI